MKIFENHGKRKWLTMVMLCFTDFCSGLCLSIPAPFYPAEAEKKGASATEYGLVLGVFEFAALLTSPWWGQRINQIGAKYLIMLAMLTSGTSTVLFGCLDGIESHYLFIISSLIVRIVEGSGVAAYIVASFAICAREFTDNTSTVFALKESFMGAGLIVGPTAGAALYELGGFATPFVTLGFVYILSAIVSISVLPDIPAASASSNSSVLGILKYPAVFHAAFGITLGAASQGFLNPTLEPHLRQFGLSTMENGLIFVLMGGSYAVSAPLFGCLCEKAWVNPKIVTSSGSILLIIGYCLIGPAPFIHSPAILSILMLGLVLVGIGTGACFVSGFTSALQTVIYHGFPDDLETYALISGLWGSSSALGFFAGPTMAGILTDALGFRRATMFVIGSNFIFAVMTAALTCRSRRRRIAYEELNGYNELHYTKNNGNSERLSIGR